MPITFITGGARSGKSAFAMKLADAAGRKAYIATAEARDDEMRGRIERHRRERGARWDTREEPIRLAGAIREVGGRYDVVVVDCLTLWLSNLMEVYGDYEAEIDGLAEALSAARTGTHLIVVANEVGMGIVPSNELARDFRDLAGRLNQRVAALADGVYLMVAGMPLRLK